MIRTKICNPEDCKEIGSLYPSERLYKRTIMTDKEIGQTAREIIDRGNTAEIKRNREGIVILEVRKEIVKKEDTSSGKEL